MEGGICTLGVLCSLELWCDGGSLGELLGEEREVPLECGNAVKLVSLKLSPLVYQFGLFKIIGIICLMDWLLLDREVTWAERVWTDNINGLGDSAIFNFESAQKLVSENFLYFSHS